jgi:DNA-binding PadR family transcriptional regulator
LIELAGPGIYSLMELPFSTKSLVLAALAQGGKGYGLDILKRIETMSGGEFQLTPAHIYPALRDLANEGFIQASETVAETSRGARKRIDYILTEEGKRQANLQGDVARKFWGTQASHSSSSEPDASEQGVVTPFLKPVEG